MFEEKSMGRDVVLLRLSADVSLPHKSIKNDVMRNYYKTNSGRSLVALLLMCFFMVVSLQKLNAQDQNKTQKSIAVINIDSKGLATKMPLMTSLVTLELERIGIYEVIDKYDVASHMKANDIALNQAYGKTDLIRIGGILKVDKVLSGSVEKFGNKIIVVLRLIDVKAKKIEKVDVMEYLDQEEDIQEMIRISLHNIFGIENDRNTVDMLSSVNRPISTANNRVNLSGPRFGATMTFGQAAERLQAPKSEGGYNMFPVSSTFGYQFEKQYISAGDFQALFEVIPALNALESGYFIPSLSVLNGFRFNKLGFEFGIGPVFRIAKLADGYYDADGNWQLKSSEDPVGTEYSSQIDSRGYYKLSTGLILAAGFTFKSGNINFPINIYVSPRKDGTVVGIILGFNVARRKKK